MDRIDRDKIIFKKRLYRDSCIKCDKFYIKDLDIIVDRKKTDIIIVDKHILSFTFDISNGVPINLFKGDEGDEKDLLYLVSFLLEAFFLHDVRVACANYF